MSSIQFVNLGEVLAGIRARTEKLEQIPKIAKQMGVLATNEIHPLTNKKTGNWDASIHAEVKELGNFKWELWVGSKGAFSGVASAITSLKAEGKYTKEVRKKVKAAQKSGSGSGYNYGARQERLYHPIEIGWFKAQPRMTDLWQQKMRGLASRTVATGEHFEFGAMAGL